MLQRLFAVDPRDKWRKATSFCHNFVITIALLKMKPGLTAREGMVYDTFAFSAPPPVPFPKIDPIT